MTRILAWETGSDWCSVALAESRVGIHHVVWRAARRPRRHGDWLLPTARGLLAEAGWAPASLDALAVGRGPGAFTGVRLGFAAAQGLAFALDRPLVPVSSLAATALRAAWPVAGVSASGETDAPALAWLHAPDDRVGATPDTHAARRSCEWVGRPVIEPLRASADDRDGDLRRVIVIRDARMGEVYAASYAALETAAGSGDDPSGRKTPLAAFVARSPERIETTDAAVSRLGRDWRDARDRWLSDVVGIARPGAASAAWFDDAPEADVDVWPHAREVARLALARPLSESGVEAWRAEPVYLRDRVAETRAERDAASSRADAKAGGHGVDG